MSPEVLIQTVGRALQLELNRPKALNALNLRMIRLMSPAVKRAHNDSGVNVAVLSGTGDKALCAGGDIKVLLGGGDGSDTSRRAQEDFFREEYMLDSQLAEMTKEIPLVAFMDGITMGGGVGVSINASFRVATEHCVFAMPETGIGFFPDVGGSYFLANGPKLKAGLGMFLGLTGARLKGKEAVAAGVATHFVRRGNVEPLTKALSEASSRSHDEVEQILGQFVEPVDEADSGVAAGSTLAFIEQVFGGGAPLDAMITGCDEHSSSDDPAVAKAASRAAKALRKMSPFSLAVTREQVIRGSDRSLAELL